MSRGKWKTTVIKNQVAVATMAAEGIRIAGLRAERKEHKKKSFMDSAREHIGLMIDRLDPAEALAMAAGTYLTHQVLSTSIDILNAVGNLPETAGNSLVGLIEWVTTLGMGVEHPKEENPILPSTLLEKNELLLWVISFLIAFIVIRFGPSIIQSMGGIAGLGKMLIGIV